MASSHALSNERSSVVWHSGNVFSIPENKRSKNSKDIRLVTHRISRFTAQPLPLSIYCIFYSEGLIQYSNVFSINRRGESL